MDYCEEYRTTQNDGIVISAYQELLDERALGGEFCWGYYFRIENNTNDRISLLGQHISVKDIKGRLVSVNTDGFKGEIPELEPGEVFEFEDYTTAQASAVLEGSFQIANSNTHKVQDVQLPVLSLIANDNNERVLN